MAITDYHRAIFDFLESYRAEHPQAGLTYSLRQKNKAGRPRNQYFFTGNDNYINIGLYKPISNDSKIRSICFEIPYDATTDSLVDSHLTIIYRDPHLMAQEAIYQQIVQEIGQEQFRKNGSQRRYDLYYTDPDWRTNLTTYLEQHKPIIDRVLQEAGVTAQFHIPKEELEVAIKVANQVTPTKQSEDYTWVPFYKELCSALWSDYTTEGLIGFIKRVLKVQNLTGLNDQDADGNRVELADMDPYTFLSFIGRGTDEKRLMVLARLKEWLSLDSPVPTGLSGLYSDQNQWVWLFGYSHERQPEDTENLRQLFEQVETNKVSEGLFNEVLWITRLTPAKLSRSLFTQRPGQYFPVTSGTKDWLRKRNLPTYFESFEDYQRLINAVRLHDSRPFYEIAAEAYREKNKLAPSVLTNYYWSFTDIGGESDHLDQFIQEGYWEGPWVQQLNEPSLIDFMQEIPVGAKLALQYCAVPPEAETKYTFQIVAIGEVTVNPGDGKSLLVDWISDFEPFTLVFDTKYDGEFIGFIEEITRPEHIQQIFFHQPDQLAKPVSTLQSKHAKNTILYGPPGTGKTYGTIDLAVDIVDGRKDDKHIVNKPRFDQLRKEGQIEFITFHQSYTYEDFVMGLKPDVDGEDLKFQRSYGIFYRIAKRARDNYEASRSGGKSLVFKPFQEVFSLFTKPLIDDEEEIEVKMPSGKSFFLTERYGPTLYFRKAGGGTDHSFSIKTLENIYDGTADLPSGGMRTYYKPLIETLKELGKTGIRYVPLQNYVLIIDEINRANMSRVFGELITLLEDDKRLGAENELTVTLPSGEPFAVPPNLYLIGTMNTADKSLALLDIALRRRFEFIGMYPNYEVVDGLARTVLERLNKSILAHHKPADFLIGHAYFIGKQPAQLPGVFNNRVIPLLMEYFNGRSDLVKTLLTDAGVKAERHPVTDQLTVSYVD